MALASDHGLDGLPTLRRSDSQLLAAVERAARHRDGLSPSARMILEHLGVVLHSPEGRAARARLSALEQRGLLKRSRRRSASVFALTESGRRCLCAAEAQLPESPQHRRWRETRALADREADRFRDDLRKILRVGLSLLESQAPVRADMWHTFERRLAEASSLVASAAYCRDWPEPDDSLPDVPPPRALAMWGLLRARNNDAV
jgi:hypothetical protein